MNCNSAKEVWDKLIGIYDRESKVKKEKIQTHRRQFKGLKMYFEEDIAAYFLQVAKVVNSLKGLGETIEENKFAQKVLRLLPECFDSKVSAIEELKDLYNLKMDELHGILTAYEMRKGIPSSKEVTFKASRLSKKGRKYNNNNDDSDTETELVQFVKKLTKGSKLKGKYPLICFKCGIIGNYVAKCPHKHDSDDGDKICDYQEEINKDISLLRGDDDDEFDKEDNCAEDNEVLFMAFTNKDDYDQEEEGNVDEIPISAIEENEKF
eukprot:PITA_28665